jgi:hypothetical protein
MDELVDKLVQKDEVIDVVNSLFIYTDDKKWKTLKIYLQKRCFST